VTDIDAGRRVAKQFQRFFEKSKLDKEGKKYTKY
jgi:hypothetical protein